MKRTILILAAVVLFVTNSISANTDPCSNKEDSKNPCNTTLVVPLSYKVVSTKIVKVNAFCQAIAKGDFEMVKKMIEMGSSVNEYSHEKTPLMYAARYNRVEIAKLLIANGAKITKKDNKGQTALKYAKLANATDVLSLLEQIKRERKS